MYNQKRWRPGKFITGHECEVCQCFGHADECFFDPQVEAERGSINADGKREGGGVCIGCRVRQGNLDEINVRRINIFSLFFMVRVI